MLAGARGDNVSFIWGLDGKIRGAWLECENDIGVAQGTEGDSGGGRGSSRALSPQQPVVATVFTAKNLERLRAEPAAAETAPEH